MSIKNYIIGYAVSIVLTLAAAGVVWLYGGPQYISLTVLALLQLAVQLRFFLHIGDDATPRANVLALCFALIVVCILVGGTLWIMANLAHGQADQGQPFIGNQITVQAEDD